MKLNIERVALIVLGIVSVGLAALIRTAPSDESQKYLCEQGQTGHVSSTYELLDCHRRRNDYLMIEEDKVRGQISSLEEMVNRISYERYYTREIIDSIKCEQLNHNDYCLGK